jgi:hypothetical protein
MRKTWVFGLASCLGLSFTLACHQVPGNLPVPAGMAATDHLTKLFLGTSPLHLAGDRQVQGIMSDRGFSSSNLNVGSNSALFGNTPLGFGFFRGGLLPFVSNGLNSGSSIFLADLNNHTVFNVPVLDQSATNPVLSGGGRFLAFSENGQLGILDMRTQLVQIFPQLNTNTITNFAVDSFGNLTYIDQNGQVHLFDTNNGQDFIVPAASRNLGTLNSNINISGNGQFIVTSGTQNGQSNIFLTSVLTGQQFSFPFLNSTSGNLTNLDLSSDGSELLFADNGQVRLLNLNNGFIDNLPLLNSSANIQDARFLDAGNGLIEFTSGGNVEVFNRNTGLIDTLPIVNSLGSTNSLGRGQFLTGGRFNRFFGNNAFNFGAL